MTLDTRVKLGSELHAHCEETARAAYMQRICPQTHWQLGPGPETLTASPRDDRSWRPTTPPFKKLEEAKKVQRAKMEAKKAKSGSSFFSSKKVDDTAEEDDDAVHTMQLSEKRLQATKRENELLFFSLSGARIFFKGEVA